MDGKDSVSYGPKSQKLSVLLFVIALACGCPFMLHAGLIDYAAIPSDQSMLQFKAIKKILAGGFGTILFIPAVSVLVAQQLTGRPRLALSPDQIAFTKLWGKSNAQAWNNLEMFERFPADTNLKPLTLQAKLVRPQIEASGKTQNIFRIPANAFNVEAYALLNEINETRAKFVGDNYVPQVKSVGEIMESEKQAALLQRYKNRRRWGLWFVGTAFLCIFLSMGIEAIFVIPKHPYENYTAVGSLVVGALVASFKRRRAS